jgi:hypothetical protein
MSCSEKHTPIIKVARGSTKISKRLAAKAARHCDLSNGCNYKRVFDSWDICDYRSNLYKNYDNHCNPKSRWFAPLSPKVLRMYWNK